MYYTEYGVILTIEELCEILIIGKNTAYRLLKAGAIKGFLEAGRWKIPREAVERYIKTRAGL